MTDASVRRVAVTRHAVEQAARRHAYRDSESGRPVTRWDRLAELIAADAEEAIGRGRLLNHKPNGFRLWKERRRQLRPGEWFVPANERRGFIVKREPNGSWLVVTVLTRAGGG